MKKKPKKVKVERPTSAFVLSLIAGILITVSGLVLGAISELLSNRIGNIFIAEGSYITLASIAYPIAGLKLIMGPLVIIGSVLMFKTAAQRMTWGITVVVFSIITLIFSVFPPGPLGLIGSILGILGGVLGLSSKP